MKVPCRSRTLVPLGGLQAATLELRGLARILDGLLIFFFPAFNCFSRFSRSTITHKIFGNGLISVFQEFSDSINKASILAGRQGTGLSFYGVWTLS